MMLQRPQLNASQLARKLQSKKSRHSVGHLQQLEQRYTFTNKAWRLMQHYMSRLAMDSTSARTFDFPLDDTPFWFRRPPHNSVRQQQQPCLDGYQSSSTLPESADVVIIGAGLTGASAAYHLAVSTALQHLPAEMRRRKIRPERVVVLERHSSPAAEASGRNGGNFELIPENCLGDYNGLLRERYTFIRKLYPQVSEALAQAEAQREASLVVQMALRNRCLFRGIVERENIDCDFSPKGWLFLPKNKDEESGVEREVELVAAHGQKANIWTSEQIAAELAGIHNAFGGRFIHRDGSYHPFKYVTGLLQAVLRAGGQLHTRTAVERIVPDTNTATPTRHNVVTNRGTIRARFVVVATNVGTSQLLPELSPGLEVRQSQVMTTEGAPDKTRGRIITSEHGPVFFHQPRQGADPKAERATLLMGGGPDRLVALPPRFPKQGRRSRKIHRLLLQLRDEYYPELHNRPPSAEWAGLMSFTRDQLPAIGILKPRIYIGSSFSGYGGSFVNSAGEGLAIMVHTGHAPCWIPETLFGPDRLKSSDKSFPLFVRDFEQPDSSKPQLVVHNKCPLQFSCAFLHGR